MSIQYAYQTEQQEENESYSKFFSEIVRCVSESSEKELTQHLLNTLQWAAVLEHGVDIPTVRSLMPITPEIKIAAMGHEFERTTGNCLRPHDFQSFDLYKQASHIRSAELVAELGRKLDIPQEIVGEVTRLIRNSVFSDHEERASILREADALSAFSLSLPFFVAPLLASEKIMHDICSWEFNRLGARGRKHLMRFNTRFVDPRLQRYVGDALRLAEAAV